MLEAAELIGGPSRNIFDGAYIKFRYWPLSRGEIASRKPSHSKHKTHRP